MSTEQIIWSSEIGCEGGTVLVANLEDFNQWCGSEPFAAALSRTGRVGGIVVQAATHWSLIGSADIHMRNDSFLHARAMVIVLGD
jgi:hypothetical protein